MSVEWTGQENYLLCHICQISVFKVKLFWVTIAFYLYGSFGTITKIPGDLTATYRGDFESLPELTTVFS